MCARTFEEFDLSQDATDATIWQTCQDHDILLITGNRNAEGPESLEITLRQRNTPNCLPVLTLADPDRIQRDRQYAEAVVERLFDILIDPGAFARHMPALLTMSKERGRKSWRS